MAPEQVANVAAATGRANVFSLAVIFYLLVNQVRRTPTIPNAGSIRSLWGLLAFPIYALRRIDCGDCGVHVESIPWASGKLSMTTVYMHSLAT